MKSFLKKHQSLLLILVFAFFLRVFKINELLGFYYDQGRDALVVWDLLKNGKFFLIGPVTGLEGIFLGPFYYYLISPFYFLGKGNPLFPSVFLSFLTVLALIPLYFLAKKLVGEKAGLLTVLVGGVSSFLIFSSRWLSNPTPILLTSTLLLFSLWKIIETKKQSWWVAAALLVGLSLHFEAASAFFYIPIVVLFAIWQRQKFPNIRILLSSLFVFIATLLSQIIFNKRHGGILWNNFTQTFFAQKGFSLPSLGLVTDRLEFFGGVLTKIFFPEIPLLAALFWGVSIYGLVITFKKKKTRDFIILCTLFLGTVFVGYTLFQGNYKTLYDYYLTGYFLIIVSLFCLGIATLWTKKFGNYLVYSFVLLFLFINGRVLIKSFTTDPGHVIYKDQLSALDWVFEDAKEVQEFNVDVYVPPVIPYAYDYLFLWQGESRCGQDLCGLVKDRQVETLYTLYEEDPPHPERLNAWLERQEGIGEIEREESFGEITVQRRKRL